MATGQINRDSFEKLTEKYFSDINECYSKNRLRDIVKHYTEIIYSEDLKRDINPNQNLNKDGGNK